MSKDKHRARDRRLKLLRWAEQNRDHPNCMDGIPIHCEGGIAMRHGDLQDCLSRRLLKIVRLDSHRTNASGNNMIRRTRAVLTEAGDRALGNDPKRPA